MPPCEISVVFSVTAVGCCDVFSVTSSAAFDASVALAAFSAPLIALPAYFNAASLTDKSPTSDGGKSLEVFILFNGFSGSSVF